MRHPKYRKIVMSQELMRDTPNGLFSVLLSCNHKKLMIVNMIKLRDHLPKTTICDLCTEYQRDYMSAR